MKNKKNDFSLIELIVIVAVIFIFCSLITNAAQKTLKDKSEVCKEHLKKINMAQAMYASENNNYMACNLFQLNTYLGYKKTDIPAVTGCPAVPAEQKRKFFYSTEYAKNAYILLKQGAWSSRKPEDTVRSNLDMYKSPDKTMLYMDYPPRQRGHGAVFSSTKWLKNGDKKGFRHNGTVNLMYIDGHVRNSSPKDIPLDGRDIFWGLIAK